jgi:dTDP-4-dehydrorhamnose 3,5-epimerase
MGTGAAVIFTETVLKGAFIIDIHPLDDDRGFFARTFCRREFVEHSLNPDIAQSNVAFNTRKGTLRGMHFQFPPVAETKLVRVTRGALLDVIVDLRPESPTFLQSVAVELTSDNRRALYVPERFAHGYQTLEDGTEAIYEMGEFYTPDAQSGLRYDDPRLRIAWPLPASTISDKDLAWPLLSDIAPALTTRMSVRSVTST